MITNEHLLLTRPNHIGGVQRIYRFAGDWGLSLINGAMAHGYPFAWEAAVLKGVEEDGNFANIAYDTPLTCDVEIFYSDQEANDFIAKAAAHFAAL
jgi:hypothetical protein